MTDNEAPRGAIPSALERIAALEEVIDELRRDARHEKGERRRGDGVGAVLVLLAVIVPAALTYLGARA